MATKRKFYKTIIEVEVLSEEPYEFDDMSDVAYDICEGNCSGAIHVRKTETLNGKEAAQALIKQDSDPEFFMIDEKGNDIND